MDGKKKRELVQVYKASRLFVSFFLGKIITVYKKKKKNKERACLCVSESEPETGEKNE